MECDGSSSICNISRVIKEPRGTTLEIPAKNQLRLEICEKIFKYPNENFNGK